MRKFEEHEINEIWCNKYCAPHARFDYEKRVIKETDERLLKNVLKCCTWVRENYPTLTMSLQTSFNAYNKLDVDINGNMTLCFGSHGYGYAMYLNNDGTAFYAQGSEQRNPYFFRGQYGFRNDQLTKFLEEWSLIKTRIISKAKSIEAITSETFVP